MPVARHGGDIFGAAQRLGVPVSAIMDFSASINPLGIPPRARRRLKEELDLVCHYPDQRKAGLRGLIASCESIDPESILFGNGATQLLHLIPRHLKPRKALLAQPGFSEYSAALRCAGCRIGEYHLEAKRLFHIELNEFLRTLKTEAPDMLILANPNNPTGAVIPPETLSAIVDICQRGRIHFVVDESFIEFTSQPSLARQASQHRYLTVLRSFTKFFAFPGLRMGYLVAHPSLVKEFSRQQEPWSVNTLAVIAAAESMADSTFREKSLNLIARERRYLAAGLTRLGWLVPYSSEANFLLVRIQHPAIGATDLGRKLEAMHILIRDCTDFRGLGRKYIRVAIRSRKENRCLLEALRQAGDTLAGRRRT